MYLWNETSPALLAGYRPNQAMRRGVYRGRTRLGGLGQTSTVSSPLLWIGGGLLALAGILYFGKKRAGGNRQVARLAARRALAAKELRELGA